MISPANVKGNARINSHTQPPRLFGNSGKTINSHSMAAAQDAAKYTLQNFNMRFMRAFDCTWH
jgi:hypothetical protein